MIKITGNMAKGVKMIQTLNLKQKFIKPNLYDYSYAYILVTENITAAGGNVNTNIAFKILLHSQDV